MIRGTLTDDPGVLEPGDEIITNQGSEMRYYVVEEIPRVSKLKTWHNGKTRYIAVKCRVAMEEKTASGIILGLINLGLILTKRMSSEYLMKTIQ